MKRIIVLALAVLGIAAASSAPAATTTLAITKNGYVPKTLTIVAGDSVTFTNQDSIAHQLVLRPSSGFSCNAGLVLQPGRSTKCAFRTVTRYSVRDQHNSTAPFRGTITVKAAPAGSTLSLSAKPSVVVFGSLVTLSGQLASGLAAQNVELVDQQCGTSAFRTVTTLTTSTNGMFSFAMRPAKNTAVEARFGASSSSPVTVKVRPKVTLRKLSKRTFRVTVLAAESFEGQFVRFQRYSRATGRWVTVRSVALRAGVPIATPIDPTSVSTAKFRVKIKARLRVRALLTQAQAGGCYAASASTTIRS
jgi:plastocyanin